MKNILRVCGGQHRGGGPRPVLQRLYKGWGRGWGQLTPWVWGRAQASSVVKGAIWGVGGAGGGLGKRRVPLLLPKGGVAEVVALVGETALSRPLSTSLLLPLLPLLVDGSEDEEEAHEEDHQAHDQTQSSQHYHVHDVLLVAEVDEEDAQSHES